MLSTMASLAVGAVLMALLWLPFGRTAALLVMVPLSLAWGFVVEPYLRSRVPRSTV